MIVAVFLVALFSVPATLGFPNKLRYTAPQCVDPTFACHDLANAKLCNVVESCAQDIWSTMNAPEDDEDICDVCKEMVKEARDQLLSNMTEEEIKEVFEGSCNLLPVKFVAKMCVKMVDEFIPQLVEMLASRMDPNMVCTVSGFCNLAHHSNNRFTHQLISIFKRQKCDDCLEFTSRAKGALNEINEVEFENTVSALCDIFGVSEKCDHFFQVFSKASVFNAVKQINLQDSCQTVGICSSNCVNSKNIKIQDDLTCQFCTHVLEHVKDLITANSTVEEFRGALHNFCNHTGSFASECNKYVDEYFDVIFAYIRDLDTKGFCTLIGICQSGCTAPNPVPMVKLIPPKDMSRKVPLVRLIPAERISVEDNEIFDHSAAPVKQLPIDRMFHPSSVFNRDVECSICKALSFYLQKDLKDDHTMESVEKALTNVCSKWIPSFPDECQATIDKYSKHMKHRILNGANFDDLCFLISACPIDKSMKDSNKLISQNNSSAPICDLCKEVFTEIENELKDPSTKDNVEKLLDQACNYLPESLHDECTSFIDGNLNTVFSILEQELQGDNICPLLKLCPNSKVYSSHKVKDVECDLCKDLVSQLKQQLTNPDVKATIKNLLENGCAALPSELAGECKNLVDNNFDAIMNMMLQYLDPSSVCTSMNLCNDMPVVKIPPKVNDVECELCKEVVGKVFDLLKDQKTEEEIKKVLDEVCDYLPSSYSAKCEQFVNQYSETIIQLIIIEMDPSMICAALNLCPESIELQRKTVQKLDDVECELCKEVVGKVLDLVKDQKTEDEIKKALDEVCDYLPSSYSAKCEQFVNQYSALVIQLILEEVDPNTICAALNLCPGSQRKSVQKLKDVQCDLCKEVVGKVFDLLKDQTTVDEIKKALDEVCDYLPSSYSAKCEQFVNQYSNLVIQLIIEEVDPNMICAALNLCPDSLKKNVKKLKDLECDLCEEVIGNVINSLKNETTKEEIKEALDNVCSHLPASFSSQCQQFVNQYTELIITLLVQDLDSNKVCSTLGLCSGFRRLTKKQNSIECDFCKDIVQRLVDELKDEKTEDSIKAALEKVCDYFPSISAKCNKFIESYATLLVDLLLAEMNPAMVCDAVKACPGSKVDVSECDMCTTVVDYFDKILEDDNVDKDITVLVVKVCKVLPESMNDKCSSLVSTYGPYILQMIGQLASSKEVCRDINMCPQVPGHVHLLGGRKCTFGPSYWCQSKVHAAACKAEMYCKQKMWK